MTKSFLLESEMPSCETKVQPSVDKAIELFTNGLYDALRAYRLPTGWQWDMNSKPYRLTETQLGLLRRGIALSSQKPEPLRCDVGVIPKLNRRSDPPNVITLPFNFPPDVIHLSIEAVEGGRGRIDVTMHYTPEGKALCDYLVQALELDAGAQEAKPELATPAPDQAGEPPRPGRRESRAHERARERLRSGEDETTVKADWCKDYEEETGMTPAQTASGEKELWRNVKRAVKTGR